MRLARQGAHPHTMGRAICYAAVLHYWRGEIDAARARAGEVVALSDQHGIFTFFTVGAKLLAHLVAGARPGLAELGAELAPATDRWRPHPPCASGDAGGRGIRRRRPAGPGLDVLAGALKAVEAGAERHYESEVHRLRGELLLAVRPRRRGRRGVLPPRRCLRPGHRRAVVRAARGDQPGPAARRPRGPGRARAALAPVLGAFTEGYDTRDLRAARALLAEIG